MRRIETTSRGTPGQLDQAQQTEGSEGQAPGYGGRRTPLVDEIRFVPVPNAATRVEGALAGQFDYADALPVESQPRLKAGPVEPIMFPAFGWPLFFVNHKQGPLTNPALRRTVLASMSFEDMLAAVILRHVLRPGLVPVLTVVGLSVALLLGGAVVGRNRVRPAGRGQPGGLRGVAAGLSGAAGGAAGDRRGVRAGQPDRRPALHRGRSEAAGMKRIAAALGERKAVLLGAAILLVLVVVAFAPLIAPYAPGRMRVAERLQAPDGLHWFGTDEFGRDIFARVVHGSTLIREAAYVEAARAVGASTPRILRRHVLRNLASPIAVQGTFVFGYAILAEAGLSFLGLGPTPETPTWGTLVAAGQQYAGQADWIMLLPGLAIVLAVFALQMVGDALRDLLDPRLRRDW